jgi:dTDP-4-dehydrorhamnose reductase
MGELSVLVLGDGLLGSELVKQSGWMYISRKSNDFDINHIEATIPKGFDVIINCIANTDTYSEDRNTHWDVNYKFVDKLIKYCNENEIKLVHISTDYLYTDSVENATEEDIPMPCKTWYGYTKLLSDGLVQLQSKNYLLCRCTHKPRPFPYDNAWEDQIGNFDYVDVIAGIIIKMINKGLCGVYNVGTETKTMYELASETKTVGKLPTPNHVPKNTSMDLRKLKQDIESPFFSIAIPTYGYNGRGAEFLKFSLNILSKQTFQNFEVILSDHSTDDTIKNIYMDYEYDKDSKMNINYFRNEKGRGIISPNINNAMKFCNGKWIKILFQDDFLFDEYALQIQADELESKPDINWAMTTFFHSNSGTDFYRHYIPKWNNLIWNGSNTMGCPSGMTIRNKDLIFFDEGLNWLMDVEYYKRMFDKYGEPYIINETTYVNRTWGARLCDTIGPELKHKELVMLTERYA